MSGPAAAARKRYSPRRSREERREQTLDAALRVVDEQGVAGLTVEAVARDADMAKTVVYDSVGNQEQVLRELIDREQRRAIDDIARAMPELPFDDPEELLASGLVKLLGAVREHPATWRLILLPPEGTPPALREDADRHREQLRSQLEPVIAWGLGQFGADDVEPEIATYALLATIETGIRMTLDEPDRFPPARLEGFARALVRRVA